MRRLVLALGLALTLIVPMSLTTTAAQLHKPHEGTACPAGYFGKWHFVNNQTEGTKFTGMLTANFDTGKDVVVAASKVRRNVQHFNVVGGTTLNTAYTDLPGKLVLSDFSCKRIKKTTT